MVSTFSLVNRCIAKELKKWVPSLVPFFKDLAKVRQKGKAQLFTQDCFHIKMFHFIPVAP